MGLRGLWGIKALRGIIGGDGWLLRDEFCDTRAAGSVDGTPADPGPGTREVQDTTPNMVVGSGIASMTGILSWTDPTLSYEDSLARAVGRFFTAKVNMGAVNTYAFVWSSDNTPANIGAWRYGVYISGVGNIRAVGTGATPDVGVGTIAAATDYRFLVLHASPLGCYIFIKGGVYTYWTLLYKILEDSTTPVYPLVLARSGSLDVDFIRIPDTLWLPTPLAYDAFGRGDGAIGSTEFAGPDSQPAPVEAWLSGGSTWAVSSNEAVNTPTPGSELLTNPSFTAWTAGVPDGWTVLNDNPPATEVTEVGSGAGHGGAGNGAANIYRSDANAVEARQNVLTIGGWYRAESVVSFAGGGAVRMVLGNAIVVAMGAVATYIGTGRASATSYRLLSASSSDDITVDSTSVKALALDELFSSVQVSTADVVISAELDVVTAYTQAGLVLNLDDKDSPANFVIAYHDGTMVYLEKCVAGTYTTVQSTVVAYAAGATLVVIKDGTSYSVYYNNAQVGTTRTIADAGIVDNTLHGMFSTYEGNQLDNFLLMPRGTGNEYNTLDRWSYDYTCPAVPPGVMLLETGVDQLLLEDGDGIELEDFT